MFMDVHGHRDLPAKSCFQAAVTFLFMCPNGRRHGVIFENSLGIFEDLRGL